MLVLFDNGTPRTLARYLIGHHTVTEARARGWDELGNGELLTAAEALGVTRNTLSALVNEKRGISTEMAVRLEQVFGGSAEGWLVQQAQYDLAHVHRERIKLKRLEPA